MLDRSPKIAVTGPLTGQHIQQACIALCVRLAGGIAHRVYPNQTIDWSQFDGLILSGGADIHPSLYGDVPAIESQYEQLRDQLEVEALEWAIAHARPVLGICRGMQMLNVVKKGTLYQEVGRVFDDFLPNTSLLGKCIARRTVLLAKPSILYSLAGKSSLRVNSLHHQAVDQLGEGLIITARLENGLAQAIEAREGPWMLGTQWHPELMFYRSTQRRIFRDFIQAVKTAVR